MWEDHPEHSLPRSGQYPCDDAAKGVTSQSFINKNLFDCTHVWIREDSVKKSLQPPYLGPFPVEKRISDRLFTINVSGRSVNVSIEHLKPAFLPRVMDSDDFPPPSSLSTPVASISTSIGKSLRTYPSKKKVYFALIH